MHIMCFIYDVLANDKKKGSNPKVILMSCSCALHNYEVMLNMKYSFNISFLLCLNCCEVFWLLGLEQ